MIVPCLSETEAVSSYASSSSSSSSSSPLSSYSSSCFISPAYSYPREMPAHDIYTCVDIFNWSGFNYRLARLFINKRCRLLDN